MWTVNAAKDILTPEAAYCVESLGNETFPNLLTLDNFMKLLDFIWQVFSHFYPFWQTLESFSLTNPLTEFLKLKANRSNKSVDYF